MRTRPLPPHPHTPYRLQISTQASRLQPSNLHFRYRPLRISYGPQPQHAYYQEHACLPPCRHPTCRNASVRSCAAANPLLPLPSRSTRLSFSSKSASSLHGAIQVLSRIVI